MIHAVVQLYAGVGGIEGLRAYEAKVMPILAEYGGLVLSAFCPENSAENDQPDEVHVIQFPSHDALARYRADERLLALAAERSLAIARAHILISKTLIPYHDNHSEVQLDAK